MKDGSKNGIVRTAITIMGVIVVLVNYLILCLGEPPSDAIWLHASVMMTGFVAIVVGAVRR